MENRPIIQIPIAGHEPACLILHEEKRETLFEEDKEIAAGNGESRWQLVEGCTYEYELPEGYTLERSVVVRPFQTHPNCGRICTNIYVGSLPLPVWLAGEVADTVTVEIQSVKTDYRSDYQEMLKDITLKCTELLMQQSAPVNQYFKLDPACSAQTLYQRFAFIRSLIASDEFADAVHRIRTAPVTKWKEAEVTRNISNLKRINHQIARQLQTRNQRVPLPGSHPLRGMFESLPQKVTVPYKEETVDIPENRFVKYVLEGFLQFCSSLLSHACAGERLKREARQTAGQLEQYLSLSLFKEVGNLTVLPLNSPVLQRKEGYREVLQAWFMFDMAARLVWKGGDGVYEAGKKDIATLYEYWLFFQLMELVTEVFQLPPALADKLIVPSKEGLELTLKQGKAQVVKGISPGKGNQRNLHVEFHYNQTFGAAKDHTRMGSWTQRMRPDYTLTIWPEGMSKGQAERQELLIHIHFDAKYRMDIYERLTDDGMLEKEKLEERLGNYKRADLLKMHAYKDAIHRTVGAYILYPGTQEKRFSSYHEIVPGLGAFAIAPGKAKDSTEGLKKFLLSISTHTRNRASQWEKISFHKQQILSIQEPQVTGKVTPRLYVPEHPVDWENSSVLVGYYKDLLHKEWILDNYLYNIRTISGRGGDAIG
ncbi:MAG: DUF2357 domain-containing protein [Tannerellaceae bacterium]|nr:DUF2357 domain-containing protein [Tannerellaceae bacterium]